MEATDLGRAFLTVRYGKVPRRNPRAGLRRRQVRGQPGINDFEVFEGGKPQKIVPLYLIRKAEVQKVEMLATQEAKPAPKIKPVPETVRNFLLI